MATTTITLLICFLLQLSVARSLEIKEGDTGYDYYDNYEAEGKFLRLVRIRKCKKNKKNIGGPTTLMPDKQGIDKGHKDDDDDNSDDDDDDSTGNVAHRAGYLHSCNIVMVLCLCYQLMD